jgi:hypothetical protein
MRSGPRSAAELAKLDPATIAALALQPRGPLMMRQRQQAMKITTPLYGRGGLNAGTLNQSEDQNVRPPAYDAATAPSLPAFNPPPLSSPTFDTDSNSYLQPSVSPAQGSASLPDRGDQTPIPSIHLPYPSDAAPASRTPAGIATDTLAPEAWKNTDIGPSSPFHKTPADVQVPPDLHLDPTSLLQPPKAESPWTSSPSPSVSTVKFNGPGQVTQADWNQLQSPGDPRLPYLAGGIHPSSVGFYNNDTAAIMVQKPLTFKDKLDVGIEGHPGAYHPPVSGSPYGSPPGLESLRSAMKKGTHELNPEVILYDGDKPYIQKEGPYRGLYLGKTSLFDKNKN